VRVPCSWPVAQSRSGALSDAEPAREFGLGRGRIYPATEARSLVHPARRLVQPPRRAVARLGLGPNARVLELGCGPGYFSPELARLVRSGRLVVFDLQPEMLALARARVGSTPHVAPVAGDAAALPFAAASFDGALIGHVLGEVPDRAACVAEVARVVCPGGSVVVVESRRDSDFVDLAELRRLFEDRGFALLDRRGIAWEYTARFRRGPET